MKYFTTPVVDAVSAAKIYIDPSEWSKVLIHPKSKKPNWLAILLLTKILYWYKSIPVTDEVTGKFLGYKKKFHAHMLQLGYKSIQEQMGCTYQEARDALACLLQAKVVHNPKGKFNGRGNIMYIEPIVENILCITNPKGVHEPEYLCPGAQILSVSGGTDYSVSANTESTCTTSCTTDTLNTSYYLKGGPSVDNPGGLPTSSTPTNNKIFDNDLELQANRKRIAAMLREATKKLRVNKL